MIPLQEEGDVNWIRLTLIKYIDRLRTALLRDVLAMQSLAPLTEVYIPWNAASNAPQQRHGDLERDYVQPQAVDFGMRQWHIHHLYRCATRNTGGHLFTVENDPGWINTIRGILLRNSLEKLRHHHRSAFNQNEPVLGRKPLV